VFLPTGGFFLLAWNYGRRQMSTPKPQSPPSLAQATSSVLATTLPWSLRTVKAAGWCLMSARRSSLSGHSLRRSLWDASFQAFFDKIAEGCFSYTYIAAYIISPVSLPSTHTYETSFTQLGQSSEGCFPYGLHLYHRAYYQLLTIAITSPLSLTSPTSKT